jgi:hypothetical protein
VNSSERGGLVFFPDRAAGDLTRQVALDRLPATL